MEQPGTKFHITSVRMHAGNHQPSWPTIPQILSVLGMGFTCASSHFFLPFLCLLLCCFHFYSSLSCHGCLELCWMQEVVTRRGFRAAFPLCVLLAQHVFSRRLCNECSHLSLLQFQAYVKGEKYSTKEKKQAKLSGSSSEKRSLQQDPASEVPWASRFVAVESDLAAIKTSIGQLSAVLNALMQLSGFGGVSLSAASLHSIALAVSVVQIPTVSGASRKFSGLGGMSLRAAPLPGMAPRLSGLQAPADAVSSVACLGVGGLSLRTAPLSGKALVGASSHRTSSLLGPCWWRGETGLRAPPLPGGLPGDSHFSGSAGVSSMGLPHVDWLHGSIPSQVLPRPVDAGMDPGGVVVSQAAATG
ncbi:hypothetical protein E2C01_020375 [Portunus trituberculatus]|uniref:Uncharacterized protein n=1 Tax=Portunus trituberculatus TaxID=210409 RepID=A0A5B7E0C1_PORTR|nr:hypothetical protein [Portunus trituberculatus]